MRVNEKVSRYPAKARKIVSTAAFCREFGRTIDDGSIACLGRKYTRPGLRRTVIEILREAASSDLLPGAVGGNWLGCFRNDLNLKQLWPEFAGDEEAVAGRVPGNAIQDRAMFLIPLAGRQKAAEVD